MAAESIQSLIAATGVEDLERRFEAQRRAFAGEAYPTPERRRDRLDRLEQALRRHEADIRRAIAEDFGHRSHDETLLFEQFMCIEGIRHARSELRKWMRPRRRGVAWWSLPGRAVVTHQPLGVIGIVVPWNYPLSLAVGPSIPALAAGNRVMVKMSEYTPRIGALFEQMIAEAFEPTEMTVVNGGVEVARRFTSLPFDHLLFTGSTPVGREVMKSAAENLTPVTLELGGKSPVIVGGDFDVAEAARRIMHGKLANGGQTCIAPDYALVPAASVDAFIAACRDATLRLYPALVDNLDYTSIINDRHFGRLAGYVEEARLKGATVHKLHPDESDAARRRFSPVALTAVSADMRVMREEIFGPILPVVPYGEVGEAIAFVRERSHPLALYYFGGGEGRKRVLRETISGGVTVNNTLLHFAQEDLPFGGVGPSGIGAYHGSEGFRTFSQAKPIYYDSRLSGSALLRPPYGKLFQLVTRLLHR
ncbi:MAG: coniferyl aldehyde dehydrogenase [Steroidobacteraceae bacterium]|jgi:coniferyl-aldehyde dehydrogenase|nr:coniferyl aldehyde dehydrogenase [Steroidobacteraceae bacterium]